MEVISMKHRFAEVREAPYIHAVSDKVWFLKRGQYTISRKYLLSLLTAEVHQKPVHHFCSEGAYTALLDSTELKYKRKRKKGFMFAVDDDAEDEIPKRKRPQQPRRKRLKLDDELPQPVDALIAINTDDFNAR